MIFLNAGSTMSSCVFSKGYNVVYRFTATLCFTIGITAPTSPSNSMVCALCLNSSDLRSDVMIRLGMNTRLAFDTLFNALMNIPVASTVSGSNEIGIIAASAFL